MKKRNLSRRDFLNLSVAAAAGSLLAACGTIVIEQAGEEAVTDAPAPAASGRQVTVNVLAQPRQEWEASEQWVSEFTDQEGIEVVFHYFAENERRSKSRLDASTGAGQYQVYYIDEANVAEFAANNWALPIKDYYPAEYNFDGFSGPLVGVLTVDGVPYGAPITNEGDIQFWRKDLLEADGIEPPTTLDEYLEVVEHFHNPPDLYGTGTRGLRGSGMNVWRFSPYLRMFGGSYLDDEGQPVFNSPEAVQAVEYYLELIKRSPSPTMSWSDVLDSFGSGKIAIVNFANLKMDLLMDEETSTVIGKMGFSKPSAGPNGSISNIAVHGLALSSAGNQADDVLEASAKFIGWWTSAETELRKVNAGFGLTNARTSTFTSPEFAALYPEEFVTAQQEMLEVQQMCILQIPEWPEIGDYLGIKLEELFTQAYAGQSYDIQATLDDAVAYAADVLEG